MVYTVLNIRIGHPAVRSGDNVQAFHHTATGAVEALEHRGFSREKACAIIKHMLGKPRAWAREENSRLTHVEIFNMSELSLGEIEHLTAKQVAWGKEPGGYFARPASLCPHRPARIFQFNTTKEKPCM